MALTQCNCGRQWTGLSQAHCTTCHHHFSTVTNFDRHRPGGNCLHPAALTDRNGKPLFKPVTNNYGVTWVHNSERPTEEDAA